MREPRFWWRKPGLLAALLSPVAAVYGSIAARRMRGAGARACIPVICVGNFTLGGRTYEFRMRPSFPKTLSREFLLVDLVNNLDRLAESKKEVLERVRERAASFDPARLRRAAREYGNVKTRKLLLAMTAELAPHG